MEPSNQAVVVAVAGLLSVVLVEAAFLVAVPMAAVAQDSQTAATSLAFSNGVFARVFPLAPASVTYLLIGALLLRRQLLPALIASAAIGLGAGFEAAGVLAIASPAGVLLSVGLSVAQAVWIVAAAIAYGFARSANSRSTPGQPPL